LETKDIAPGKDAINEKFREERKWEKKKAKTRQRKKKSLHRNVGKEHYLFPYSIEKKSLPCYGGRGKAKMMVEKNDLPYQQRGGGFICQEKRKPPVS